YAVPMPLVAKAANEYPLLAVRPLALTVKTPSAADAASISVTPGPPMVGFGLSVVRAKTIPTVVSGASPALVTSPPSLALVSVIAVEVGLVTVGGWNSTAPRSTVPPRVRGKPEPRWSVVKPAASVVLPVPMAAAPPGSIVAVGPPFAVVRGPRLGL